MTPLELKRPNPSEKIFEFEGGGGGIKLTSTVNFQKKTKQKSKIFSKKNPSLEIKRVFGYVRKQIQLNKIKEFCTSNLFLRVSIQNDLKK